VSRPPRPPRLRRAVAAAAFASAAITIAGGLAGPPDVDAARSRAFTRPLVIPKVITAADITLHAVQADVPILPGRKTRMWTYGGTFPGPTIRRPAGETTTLTLVNDLPAAAGSLTLHNHGNHSASESDGQPDSFLAAPGGGSVTYTYTGTEAGGNERGAMQWYHDHRMEVTGRNVWMGLAGMYIIDDPADPQSLPKGAYDVPLMVVDRSFDAKNQLHYAFDLNGVMGTTTLVNGVPQPYFAVADRRYRLRILNASNARAYDFALTDGMSVLQVGTESGLLPAPVKRTRIHLAPAERVEIVVDFTGRMGRRIVLRDLAADGSQRDVMQFRVVRHAKDDSSVPAVLRPLPPLDPAPAAERTFEFGQNRLTDQWTINGLAYDPATVLATPKLGTTEEWTFVNRSGLAHVVHVHDVDQQLVSRDGKPPLPWETMKESWVLGIGETVTVRLKFTDNIGTFMLHCHILEHEDDAMMNQFRVVP
jgi:spore coat protein A, manganese oxidase